MSKMSKILRKTGFGVVVIAVLGGVAFWAYKSFATPPAQIEYITTPAIRQSMENTISSTGTVEPEELVNVGAQVGGMITTFGTDVKGKTVDYTSEVKAGQMLALIDDSLYAADVKQARAQLAQSEANIKQCEANIKQAQAKLLLATNEWERAQKLLPQNAISRSEYDSAESEFISCTAAIATNEAALAVAKAQKASNEATLERAEYDLNYCTISSPVDGVIIDRRVNIGQTVNSSMSAPSLFLIAKDLKKMQIWVSVNEADIGSIKVGQDVEFTVDAFPERNFKGTVSKVRLNATMSQNVVTYVVEIATDNSDGTLLPYLTANVKFILDRRDNALTVPNAALRFTPQISELDASAADFSLEEGERVVYVKEGSTIRPIALKTGLNDGVNTEILSGDLQEQMEVITGSRIVSVAAKASNAENNSGSPFLPKPPQRNNKKSGENKK